MPAVSSRQPAHPAPVRLRGRALVLAAGLGTRLRPLTYTRAKPAVPIGGETLIGRIARWLAGQEVRDLVVNLHYRPESITGRLGDGSDLGVRVRYSWEPDILGSAGGPRKALSLLDADQFFVVNGDTLTDVDLHRLAQAHAASGALVTLAVTANRWPNRYGGVLAGRDGIVEGFVPRGCPQPSRHFVGVQLVHRSVFAGLPAGEYADSIQDVYVPLLGARPGSVRVFACEAVFHDVGTPEDYLETALAFARMEGLASLPVGRGSRIDPSARLVDTAVWDDVEIGPGVELTRCVVGDGARVTAGTRLRDCAVVPAAGHVPKDGQHTGGLLIARIEPRHGPAAG
jgi:mannose-1-phosphate guanylyltransferase